MDELPNIFIPASLSAAYLIHFFLMMMVYFFCIALASKNIYSAKKILNELAKTQVDRLYEIMGLENEPYIVTKVIDENVTLHAAHRTSRSYRNAISEELGYKLTFISQEFHVQFLPGFEAKIEDLVFRKVNLDDMYE